MDENFYIVNEEDETYYGGDQEVYEKAVDGDCKAQVEVARWYYDHCGRDIDMLKQAQEWAYAAGDQGYDPGNELAGEIESILKEIARNEY